MEQRLLAQPVEGALSHSLIVGPTVKRGHARLRISLSANHKPDDCDALLAEFEALNKR